MLPLAWLNRFTSVSCLLCLCPGSELGTLWQVRREVDLMRSKHNTVPGLAVIMVGERRDSAKYVSMKQVRRAFHLDATLAKPPAFLLGPTQQEQQRVVFLAHNNMSPKSVSAAWCPPSFRVDR